MKIGSIILPFIIAILGGIWFGLFSCGGYAWWRSFFKIVFLCAFIPYGIYACRKMNRVYSEKNILRLMLSVAGIVVLACITYEFAQAGAAQFYLGPPDGFIDWFSGTLSQLFGPPC